jgi:transcriptional regulator with XRE-family HTH domain
MLSNRLKELRSQKKKTQKEIAAFLGITRQGYGNYENGVTEPDTETIQKLADFFGVSTDYLLGRTDDPTPPRQTSVPQTNIPSWATRKDVRDFKKMLEEDAPVMFDGVPLDEEDREKVMRVMEAIFWDAKKRNKRKPVEE